MAQEKVERLTNLANVYIDRLRRQSESNPQDTYALKAVSILELYRDSLKARKFNPKEKFFTAVGFHAGILGAFQVQDILNVEKDEVASCDLMKEFIGKLPPEELNKDIGGWSWKRYQEEALQRGLDSFTIKKQIDQHLKEIRDNGGETSNPTYILKAYRIGLSQNVPYNPELDFYRFIGFNRTGADGEYTQRQPFIDEDSFPHYSVLQKFLVGLPDDTRTAQYFGGWSWQRYLEEGLGSPMLRESAIHQKKIEYSPLIEIINRYIESFEKRKRDVPTDTYAAQALELLKNYRYSLPRELSFKGPLDATPCNLKENELPSHFLMKQFIGELLSSRKKHQSFEEWENYKNTEIQPVMQHHKEKALEFKQNKRLQLQGLFDTFENSLMAALKERMQKFTEEALIENPSLRKLSTEGLTWKLLYELRNVTGKLAKDNKEAINVITFMYSYRSLLDKEKISAVEVSALDNKINNFQDVLLKMPETNQVTEYHWLINILCNLINSIYKVFETENNPVKMRANRFFTDSRSIRDEAEEQVKEVERKFTRE